MDGSTNKELARFDVNKDSFKDSSDVQRYTSDSKGNGDGSKDYKYDDKLIFL